MGVGRKQLKNLRSWDKERKKERNKERKKKGKK